MTIEPFVFFIALIVVAAFLIVTRIGRSKPYMVTYYDLTSDIEKADTVEKLYDLRHSVRFLYATYYETEKQAYTHLKELNNLIDKRIKAIEKPKIDSLKLQEDFSRLKV